MNLKLLSLIRGTLKKIYYCEFLPLSPPKTLALRLVAHDI